jgi:hypothetical protein
MERSGSVGDRAMTEAPRPPSELQQLANGVERALKLCADTFDVASALRDRLFGGQPQPADKAQPPRPVRGGIVGGLQDRADDLNGSLERLHVLLADITRVA